MITPSDAAQILAAVAAFDQRTVGIIEAQAWAAALNHDNPTMTVDDALQAVVEWHAETLDATRMRPAHVSRGAKTVANRRAAAEAQERHAPGCRDIVTEFGSASAEQVRAIHSGATPRPDRAGLERARAVLDTIAARRSIPEREELSRSERIRQAAILRARSDRRISP
jgi:glycerate-2-kinase